MDARLEENGAEPCHDGALILKRSFTSAGANRQFVNASPTTLAVLKTARRSAGRSPRPARSPVAPLEREAARPPGRLRRRRPRARPLTPRSSPRSTACSRSTPNSPPAKPRWSANSISCAIRSRKSQAADSPARRGGDHSSPATQSPRTAAASSSSPRPSSSASRRRTIPSSPASAEVQRAVPRTGEARSLAARPRPVAGQRRDRTGGGRPLAPALSDRLDIDPRATRRNWRNASRSSKPSSANTAPPLDEVIAFGEQAAERLRKIESRGEELARLDRAIAGAARDIDRARREAHQTPRRRRAEAGGGHPGAIARPRLQEIRIRHHAPPRRKNPPPSVSNPPSFSSPQIPANRPSPSSSSPPAAKSPASCSPSRAPSPRRTHPPARLR